jgi:hypothetical protein
MSRPGHDRLLVVSRSQTTPRVSHNSLLFGDVQMINNATQVRVWTSVAYVLSRNLEHNSLSCKQLANADQ